MPKTQPIVLPIEYSSSEGNSSDSETSVESELDKEIHSIRHAQSERFEESKYLTEASIEIDYKKGFIEDLEPLFPLSTIEIRETRDTAKEFCDHDKNYPFDPIPGNVLRFFVYSVPEYKQSVETENLLQIPKYVPEHLPDRLEHYPEHLRDRLEHYPEHLLFKASTILLKRRNRFWTDYLFDSLFVLPEGQFLFRVKRRITFGSHLFRSNLFGNSAVVSAGDFGRKYLGRVNQVFSWGGKRCFRIEDCHAQFCLKVEAPSASWTMSAGDKKMTASLEFKFPNGKLYATLNFKGNYARPKVARRCALKCPSLICDDSIANIIFNDLDIRAPVELRALVFASYILFYHQYWEYKKVGSCPLIIIYIFITICLVLLKILLNYLKM